MSPAQGCAATLFPSDPVGATKVPRGKVQGDRASLGQLPQPWHYPPSSCHPHHSHRLSPSSCSVWGRA